MIDLSVNKESLKHNIENARKNNVILPTYEEMKDPGKIPAKIQEKLKNVGLWDVNPDRRTLPEHPELHRISVKSDRRPLQDRRDGRKVVPDRLP